ncbi:FADD [Branchiostoma lanceolatum]|uniref:FADD protein n=1 Tax=Branchiostoma lanceolatum TaxID=7740 RepID=A0A8J9VDP3_BRALA|nr:FADD [Branchiostoma lanceolatum]
MGRHNRRKRDPGKCCRNLGAIRSGKGLRRKHSSAAKIRHRCRLGTGKGQQGSRSARFTGAGVAITQKNRPLHTERRRRLEDVCRVCPYVASNVAHKWRDLARELGLTEPDISAIDANQRGNAKESCIEALETWRLRSGRDATVSELKKALVAAGLKLVADDIDDHLDTVPGNQSPPGSQMFTEQGGRHHHEQRLTLTVHIQEGSVHVEKQGWNLQSEMHPKPTAFTILSAEMLAAADVVSERAAPVIFQSMPCQGTFGNRKRDRVCHGMVTQLEKLAWQGHWQKLERFASSASRRFEDQPDVVIRVMFECHLFDSQKVLACNFRYDLEGGYTCLKQAEELLFKTDDAHHHQARMLEVKAVLLKKQKKYHEAKTAIDLAQQVTHYNFI